jgi:hypothetical protein
MTDGFPALNEVAEGKLKPEQLRKQSLLGSTTMLRAMAGVYYELSKDYSDDEIGDFFAMLAQNMDAPITEGSQWLKIPGNVFSVGANAPKARSQDIKQLTETVVEWGRGLLNTTDKEIRALIEKGNHEEAGRLMTARLLKTLEDGA